MLSWQGLTAPFGFPVFSNYSLPVKLHDSDHPVIVTVVWPITAPVALS
jgi:hypothetical protein